MELKKKTQMKADVKDIGDKWNQLPEEEKNKYIQMGKLQSERYAQLKTVVQQKPLRVKIQTQIKLTSICKIIRRLDKAQQQAVTDMGFHGILSLRYTHIDHDLCHWLVQNFDPSTHSLNVHGLRMLLTVEDVHELMGLPSNGLSVKLTESVDEITSLCDELAVKNKFVPFTSLKSYLIKTKDVRTEFKKKFVLYIIGALLCPTTKAGVHQSFIPMVKNVESISQFNWAKHTLDFLVDRIAIAKVKERSTVCGCLLLLMLFYLEQFARKNELVATSNPITRLSYLGNSKIKQGLNQIKALGGYLNVEPGRINNDDDSRLAKVEKQVIEIHALLVQGHKDTRQDEDEKRLTKVENQVGKILEFGIEKVAANSLKFVDEDEIRNMNDKEPMETSRSRKTNSILTPPNAKAVSKKQAKLVGGKALNNERLSIPQKGRSRAKKSNSKAVEVNAVTMSSSCSVVRGPQTRGTQNCKASQWLCTPFVKFDVMKKRPQLKPSSNNNNVDNNIHDNLDQVINLIVVKLTNKQRKKFPNKDHMLLQYAHGEGYVQDVSSFAFQWLEDMPRQDNSYDCGLFVIKYMQGKPLPLDVIKFDYLHRARLLLDLVIYKHNSAPIVGDIAQYKAELRARGELKRNGTMSRSSRTLYVGNLPGDIREREVEDLFYKYGPIAHIDLKIPPRPPGYAFVEFEEARDAEDAIRGRDGYDFDGHRLRVELAHGGRGNSSSIDRYSCYSNGRGPHGGVSRRSEYCVLVSRLPSSTSWQDVKDHMRRAGDVCFSQVFRDGSVHGKSRTTGIVDYTNYDDMKYAIRKLDDSEFRNAFTRAIVRYKSSRSQSRSWSRSYSRSRSRSRSYSRGRSYSRSRSLSQSRSRSSKSPKAKSVRRSPAKSHSRSASRSRSGSKPRSLSSYQERYGCMRLSGDWIVGSWWDVVQMPATLVVAKLDYELSAIGIWVPPSFCGGTIILSLLFQRCQANRTQYLDSLLVFWASCHWCLKQAFKYDLEEASRLLEHSSYKGLVDIKFGLFLELLQISIKIQISRTICKWQKRMSESPKKHSSSRSRSKSVSRRGNFFA
ncbi:unnamed protein product [Camellia sinensis]